MKNLMKRPAWLAAGATLVAATTLVACGGGGGSSAGTGTLRMAMTDAPACGWDNVWVTVDRVRVHSSSTAGDNDAGWSEIALGSPQRIDLLSLTNGVLFELGETSLPAGQYTQVRLVLVGNTGANPLANAVKPTGGTTVALDTPSGQQSGLKLQANFSVPAGQRADLVLDFDACKSVVTRGGSGQYNLKPVMSVTPRLDTGIAGYVATGMAAQQALVTAQDASGNVLRSTVADPATGRFFLPFLAAGSYSVVANADGFSTAVVPSVPVTTTTGITTINGTATAILTPASSMKAVTGTVTVGSSAATDATVRATQALTTGPTVEISSRQVDAITANYSLSLPTAAPQRYSFTGGVLGSATADTAVAGLVTLEATLPSSSSPLANPVDLGTVTSPLNFGF